MIPMTSTKGVELDNLKKHRELQSDKTKHSINPHFVIVTQQQRVFFV